MESQPKGLVAVTGVGGSAKVPGRYTENPEFQALIFCLRKKSHPWASGATESSESSFTRPCGQRKSSPAGAAAEGCGGRRWSGSARGGARQVLKGKALPRAVPLSTNWKFVSTKNSCFRTPLQPPCERHFELDGSAVWEELLSRCFESPCHHS